LTATRPASRLDVSTRLGTDDVAAVIDLLDAVTDADGVHPLSEHVMLHLSYGGDTDARHLLASQDGRLVGYGHIDVTDTVEGSAAELAVHPDARRRGIGRMIVARMIDETPDGRLRLWAHGQHPGAAALARDLGFHRERVLWQMRRSLFTSLPAPELPEGIRLRTFVPGQDEQAWTEVNNRAFADHPDQGHWSIEEIRTREQEPWFDPQGFLLAERVSIERSEERSELDSQRVSIERSEERSELDSQRVSIERSEERSELDSQRESGELVGFHWTKVHGGKNTDNGHVHEPIGEVYVVGVDPAAQGTGLGPALTLAGLRHLRSRGLSQAMLYVDESNTRAIALYERLGFARWDTDVCFVRS